MDKEFQHIEARIRKRFHKACADYALIEEGDHILVGLSGGKDSLALVELLGKRSKIYVPRFRVTALHVRMREINYESDTAYLEQFCKDVGVELIVREASINAGYNKESGEDNHVGKEGKSHCFLCSWYRRKMLFDVAQELGCNKIDLGHHKDDIVQTLLMNLINQGAFATIPPKLQMERMPLQLIRPLCLVEEKDLIDYARYREYVSQRKLCPFEHESTRSDVREIVDRLKELNPNALDSIWGAMENIKTEYLPRRSQCVSSTESGKKE